MDLASVTVGWQYLTQAIDEAGTQHYLLARLRQRTISLTTRADYAFSPQLTVQMYLQPYLGAGRFDRLAAATAGGHYAQIETVDAEHAQTTDVGWLVDVGGRSRILVPLPDFNARKLNGSAVLRWEYRAGSELYLVWTQSRTGSAANGTLAVGRDVAALFQSPPRNVLLAKASYYWEP
ncbi:MAG: hypothetical protein H0X39_19170 [Actinobacteria bacterium]|nr:hypothetical protein [Actinomycetota bacterium]